MHCKEIIYNKLILLFDFSISTKEMMVLRNHYFILNLLTGFDIFFPKDLLIPCQFLKYFSKLNESKIFKYPHLIFN